MQMRHRGTHSNIKNSGQHGPTSPIQPSSTQPSSTRPGSIGPSSIRPNRRRGPAHTCACRKEHGAARQMNRTDKQFTYLCIYDTRSLGLGLLAGSCWLVELVDCRWRQARLFSVRMNRWWRWICWGYWRILVGCVQNVVTGM